MGKMEQTLKSEITRLARKEMRVTYLPLVRDVRRLKRTVSALRRTVAVLARLRAELQAERTAAQARLATLVGVSTSAVGSWEYGKAKPEGHNREALVALRKRGKREVQGILAAKAAESPPVPKGRARGRKKQR